jgi:hypothetical protein
MDTSDPDLPLAMARYNQFFAGTYPGRVEIGRISYDVPYLFAKAMAESAASSRLGPYLYDRTTDQVIRNIDDVDHYTATRLGFGIDWSVHDGLMGEPQTVHAVRVPTWFLTLALALLPLLRARKWYRARRRLPGCCQHCGYDLRATLERCPECGAVPRVLSDQTSRGSACTHRIQQEPDGHGISS